MHFTWFDTIVLIILSLSTFLGAHKGVISIIFGIISFALSIVLSYYLYPYIETFLAKSIEDELVLSIASGTISYFTAFIICYLIAYKIKAFLPTKSFVDRLIGLAAGFVRGVFFCLVIFSGIIIFSSSSYLEAKNLDEVLKNVDDKKNPKWLKKSLSNNYLSLLYELGIKQFPKGKLESIKIHKDEAKDDVASIIEKVDKKSKQKKTQNDIFDQEFESELNEK